MRIGLAIVFLTFLFSCQTSQDDRRIGTDMIDLPIDEERNIDEDELPVITFKETLYETGPITQGEIMNFVYEFENTGKAPLVISTVSGSCGCTIPRSYPTGKIMPGEGGKIEVEFDSDNKWGKQTVSITVASNAVPSLTQLLIKTDIVVPDNMKTN